MRHHIHWFILARMSIPEKIGRYEIKEELSDGDMAKVYLAYDPRFAREVAIKVLSHELPNDPQFHSRFERELKIAAGLEHPAIVPVYDVGEEDGQPYYVMRYMSGGSLARRINKEKLTVQETARIIERVAQALAYAHKKGIVHRDLKPHNILFDEHGDPFLSDFGVAKLTETTVGLTGGGLIGTPEYMSPEQAKGTDIDLKSDIYSLGVIIFQMLSGQQPFTADSPMGVVIKHITEPVPEIFKVNPDLPAEVNVIIKTALAKDKDARYATILDLAKALNLAAFGVEGDTSFVSKNSFHHSTSQQSRGKIGLVVMGIVLAVMVVGFFVLRNLLLVVEPPAPTAATTPTLVTFPTLTSIPTLSGTPTLLPSPTAAFAPFCSADVLVPTPAVRLTGSVCAKKIPYVSLVIPAGATFEVSDPQGSCIVEATSNGKTVLSCSGPSFLVYDLKVCVPPVIANPDLDKCSQGDTFDSANQCCIAAPPEGAGCTLYEIKLKGCG